MRCETLSRSRKAIEEASFHRQQGRDIAQQMRVAFASNRGGDHPGAELQAELRRECGPDS